MPKARAPAADQDLFEVDRAGSTAVRTRLLAEHNQGGVSRLRKGALKPLRSAEILAQRDGASHDGLVRRQTPSRNDAQRRAGVTAQARRRMDSIARRPANAKPKGDGLWSVARRVPPRDSLVEQPVGKDGAAYDAWATVEPAPVNEMLPAVLAVKPPTTLHKHHKLAPERMPLAIPAPDAGTSYNPTDVDHDRLLRHALATYESEDGKLASVQAVKDRIDAARKEASGQQPWQAIEADVDRSEVTPDENVAEPSDAPEKRATKRKLIKDKKRALRNRRAQALIQLQRAHERSQRHAFHTLPGVVRNMRRRTKHLEEVRTERTAREEARLASLGVRHAPAPALDFQTGDELAESLRTLRPEGSLFRDWAHSAARRGKVERDHGLGGRTKRAKGRRSKDVERYSFKFFK